MSWRGTTLGYFKAVSQNYLLWRGMREVDPDSLSKGRNVYSSGVHRASNLQYLFSGFRRDVDKICGLLSNYT
jgi:hypothetical protein